MPTKTDVKNLGVDDLRELLSEHFDNITEDHTKDDLKAIVDEHWDETLNLALNPESEEEEEEVEDIDLDKPNPKTDLYSGRIRG